jgi:hypothetical protein
LLGQSILDLLDAVNKPTCKLYFLAFFCKGETIPDQFYPPLLGHFPFFWEIVLWPEAVMSGIKWHILKCIR